MLSYPCCSTTPLHTLHPHLITKFCFYCLQHKDKYLPLFLSLCLTASQTKTVFWTAIEIYVPRKFSPVFRINAVCVHMYGSGIQRNCSAINNSTLYCCAWGAAKNIYSAQSTPSTPRAACGFYMEISGFDA